VTTGTDELAPTDNRSAPKKDPWAGNDKCDKILSKFGLRTTEPVGRTVVLIEVARMKQGEQRHDTLFKETFSKPENARAEAIMTLAEQLEDRGEQRGLAKGRVEGARSVLLKLLALKFTAVNPEFEERIAHAREADLQQWSERILSASSLDEVFHR
jgi:hypothetical protein